MLNIYIALISILLFIVVFSLIIAIKYHSNKKINDMTLTLILIILSFICFIAYGYIEKIEELEKLTIW